MTSQVRVPERVELMIACQDLADIDLFTKTDPMCVVFVKQFGQWKEFGRTEAIRETLNPRFTESFVLDYEPTIQQLMLFSVYDIDSRSMDLRHHDFVGSVEIKLEDLMDPEKKLVTTTKTLRVAGDPKSRGLIHITSELMKPSKGKIQIHAAGHKLDKIGIMRRKPDCYLEIGRQINSITFQPVFRTEVLPKTRHPWWRPFDVTIQKICNDDWDRTIQFSCWHTLYGGGFKTYEMIGQCTTTLRQISTMPVETHYRSFPLICPKKERNNKKNTEAGSLRFYQFRVDMQYSLLDYIRGGCRLRLITAIDFTASNGVITDPLSLHSLQEARNNQYLNALEALGSVIARYDPEQKVAAFGFGAKPSLDSPTDYCLQLTPNTWATGIKGVSEAYQNILPSLTFAGPTYISPILDKVMEITDVNVTQDDQMYYVLLVITDGIINDMDVVVQKLVDASSLPLSIIILGVGPSDFTLMEQFHQTSHAPLFDNHTKKKAERSNIHFAALKADSVANGSHTVVVQEALATLSSQVLQYMKMRCITPGPPNMNKMDPTKSWIDKSTLLEGEDNGDPLAYLNLTLDGTSLLPNETQRVLSQTPVTTVNSDHGLKRSSFKVTQKGLTGLHCPTCGSYIEPGTSLYSDMMKIS